MPLATIVNFALTTPPVMLIEEAVAFFQSGPAFGS
jgi:hypothetical protein